MIEKSLAEILPRLKKPFQLVGLIMLIAGGVATRAVEPKAVQVTICAGAIGVLFIVFGQVFSAIPSFPAASRVRLILSLFSIFVVFVLALIGLTGYFLTKLSAPSSQVVQQQKTANATESATPLKPPLHILMKANDPRFRGAEGKKAMNWGGGSQGIFIETTRPLDATNDDPPVARFISDKQLAEANRQNLISRVFELTRNCSINVEVTYDAPKDADGLVIREWGLEMRKQPIPKGYVAHHVVTGGADVTYDGFYGKIPRVEDGTVPLLRWLESPQRGDGNWRRGAPRKFTYLRPGEPVGLLINIDASWLDEPSGLLRKRNGIGSRSTISQSRTKVVGALLLRVYAKVSVAGVESTIHSGNAVRMVAVSLGSDYNSISNDDDLIENLRPQAFVRE